MDRPRYMEELLAIVFLGLGSMFIAMGFLSFIGVLKPKASSMVQDPTMLGIVFTSIGIAFFAMQFILKMITRTKRNLHTQLLVNGIKIIGIVEKVHFQRYTKYRQEAPYRIFYTYTYQDKIFHGKSHLLWDKPEFIEGDSIEIYINDFGKSTVCTLKNQLKENQYVKT